MTYSFGLQLYMILVRDYHLFYHGNCLKISKGGHIRIYKTYFTMKSVPLWLNSQWKHIDLKPPRNWVKWEVLSTVFFPNLWQILITSIYNTNWYQVTYLIMKSLSLFAIVILISGRLLVLSMWLSATALEIGKQLS